MRVRDLIEKLQKDGWTLDRTKGWTLDRTKGSHRQFVHQRKPGVVTVPSHPSQDVPAGTLISILKQAGLKT